MKYGLNSIAFAWPFPEDPFQLFSKVKGLGFDIIEIMDSDDSRINVSKILKASEKTGLGVSLMGWYEYGVSRCGDISSENEEKRKEGLRYAKSMIDRTEQLGLAKLSNAFYAAIGKTGPINTEARERQWYWAVENYKIITEYAGVKEICLAIEPCDRYDTNMITTVDECLELIMRIGNQENLGIHLDNYHMQIEEEDIRKAIIKCGTRLKTIHACGVRRQAPGYDNFDWAAVKAGCQAIRFDGEMTIEGVFGNIPAFAALGYIHWNPAMTPELQAEMGLDFLKRLFW